MSLTYTTYLNSITNLMPVTATDTFFATDLPNVIDDAEQRCYRDLQLLNTITQDSSAALTTGTRSFTLPSTNGTFVVTTDICVITPAGTTNPELGTRNSLTPVSREFLDFNFGNSSYTGLPAYYAMNTQAKIFVGPFPDNTYQVEVSGTVRPTALSSSNLTTILSVYFPDLFIAASMVRVAGFMKNYGAAVDDPQQGVTWDQHYSRLLQGAQVEEAMKRLTGQGWSPQPPAPIATPART